jgi:hypothetical protein
MTGSTERARIDSSGRLLIGTSSSSANAAAVLQGFAGSSTGQGILQLQVGKNTAATVANENLGSLRFANSDGNLGALISGEAELQWNSSDYPSRLVFSTTADGASSPTERMRITSGGNVNITNGNLVFSTAGTGIDFSATADGSGTITSELLDDYEEGNWTPALIGTTAATYYNQVGRYVKIGKMIHVQALLQTASQTFSDNNAQLQISGLPYTPSTNTGYYVTPGNLSSQYLNFNAASNTEGVDSDYLNTGINSSNNIVIQGTSKNGVRGTLRNSAIHAQYGSILEFNLIYYTAS